jgi:hypothetical protein
MGKRRRTTKGVRVSLFEARHRLNSEVEQELGIQIPFDTYLQDPLVAEEDPKFGFDAAFVPWEPGLTDGPTSARFVVVDYNADTEQVAPPAIWDEKKDVFRAPDGTPLDREHADSLQFHQVNTWAVLQRALHFFESGFGLGRPIPFGFEGNRLIVVPHAGYGQNAFYDRRSKSLQFYYFDEGDDRVYTCLSADIVNHEFGHAVLDGIRPLYLESGLVQTAAFHEFLGDITAILLILRNTRFRDLVIQETAGDIEEAAHLHNIAEQFGRAVSGKPYLRSAANQKTMADVAGRPEPHLVSEVLTGAMFEILLQFYRVARERGRTAPQAFWDAVQRMQRTAVQPLDLLPPVDVTFEDYARAVLRAEQLSNPTDPREYTRRMLDIFVARGVLDASEREELLEPRYVMDRLRLKVFHEIDDVSRSRAAAYRFLDDNRSELLIPAHQDVVIADLYNAKKRGRQSAPLPRQVVLQYVWREDVRLEGARFGEYEGEWTELLCGGTLVFDDDGNVLSWTTKPGTEGDERSKPWKTEMEVGATRREDLLDALAERIRRGQVGAALGTGRGMLGSHLPPVEVTRRDGVLRFSIAPHLSLSGESADGYEGGPRWQVSS